MSWPTVDEIDKMDLNVDMFDVERFNSIQEERLKNISEIEKENYISSGKYDLDAMDDKLFKFLEPEEQKEYNRRKEILEEGLKIPEPRSGIETMNNMLDPFKKAGQQIS